MGVVSQAMKKPGMIRGPLLVRDYIDQVLYGGSSAYFNARPVIGRLPSAIDFASLKDENAYRRRLHDLYWENPDGWLTPVEIFQPTYALAILSWIRSKFRPGQSRLQILEVGGGLGTCARNILDHLKRDDAALYDTTSYSLLDISAQYHDRQRAVLGDHEGRCHFHLGSAAALPDFREIRDDTPTFVLALECLDNLSHDKICDHQQVMVRPTAKSASAPWVEFTTPITDPLILDYLDVLRASDFYETDSALSRIQQIEPCEFIPTTAFAFLRRLIGQIPDHHLLVADFNSLPDTISGAVNAPIVAERSLRTAGDTVDHDTYLLPADVRADIFFPVDFAKLRFVYDHVRAGAGPGDRPRSTSRIQSTRDFMLQYGDWSRCRTGSGYNPLLDDYRNTSIFTS